MNKSCVKKSFQNMFKQFWGVKKNRVITVVVGILAALALIVVACCVFSGCDNQDTKKLSPENQKAHDALQVVINEHQLAIQDFKSAGSSPSFWASVGNAKRYLYVESDGDTPVEYTFLDLDDDNIDELLIRCGNNEKYIQGIFTFKNDNVQKIGKGWSRSRPSLAENSLIRSEGSGGAAYGDLSVRKISINIEHPSDILEDNSNIIESITWEPWTSNSLKLSKTKDNNITETIISNDELRKCRNEIIEKYPDDSQIDWTSLV